MVTAMFNIFRGGIKYRGVIIENLENYKWLGLLDHTGITNNSISSPLGYKKIFRNTDMNFSIELT